MGLLSTALLLNGGFDFALTFLAPKANANLHSGLSRMGIAERSFVYGFWMHGIIRVSAAMNPKYLKLATASYLVELAMAVLEVYYFKSTTIQASGGMILIPIVMGFFSWTNRDALEI
eukprot:Clim_evm45s149 gene=Clim_evmTU45s149